jgi:ankyrin repeat protein
LRKSLETLPPTLDETYDRILCAIDTEDSKYADRILRWLAFAARPLILEEIAEVVAIDVERSPAFDSEEVLEDPLEVLSICSSLVTITTTKGDQSTTKVVAFAHYSVKEYLTSERILQSRAARYSIQDIACNEFIAKGCIGYLLQFQTLDSLSSEKIQESKLALYTAEFWISHAEAAAPETEALNRLIMELFSTMNNTYQNWTRLYDLDNDQWEGPNFDRILAEVPAPLYYASLSGLVNIVALLVFEDGADINAQGGVYGNALQAASFKGHNKTVKLLLAHGADINAQGGRYSNALQAASARGHNKTVELLLAHGADINEQGGHDGNALQAASGRGRNKTIKLLLAYGADINAQGGLYGNALQATSVRGHNKTVELLLAYGADINAQGGAYSNALQAASIAGHSKTVELLLTHGADINTQGGAYGNALQVASARGHNKTIELLLAHGADINAQGGLFGNALQAASVKGRDKTIELLLAHGASSS